MKILGFLGSPRKGGNTDTLIDRVFEGARSKNAEVEKIYLSDLKINPCQACFSCEGAKKCVIPDDMQKIYPKIREATGFVVGTPVYMSNVSALLLNFLDRCRPFISYVEALVRSELPASEEKKISEDKACLQQWKGMKYSEISANVEVLMAKAIESYREKHGENSHPHFLNRFKKGKKGVVILSYGQNIPNRYPAIADFLKFNLDNFIIVIFN